MDRSNWKELPGTLPGIYRRYKDGTFEIQARLYSESQIEDFLQALEQAARQELEIASLRKRNVSRRQKLPAGTRLDKIQALKPAS